MGARGKITGKYAKYFQDERQWSYSAFRPEQPERRWRSEFISYPEHPDPARFLREASNQLPPDRGGWSARGQTKSFRTRAHEKDPRGDGLDEGCMKAWRKASLRHAGMLQKAPLAVIKDPEARVSAALSALRHTEKALAHVAKVLSSNRDVVLELLFGDFNALKDAAQQLRRDRKHLLKDVHADFVDLRTKSKELEEERKVLLQELEDENASLERKAYDVQAVRDDAVAYIRLNYNQLEQRLPDLIDDPSMEEIRVHWDLLEQLHSHLLDDREMLVKQVMRYWPGLNYVAQHVRDDRKILVEAVKPQIEKRTVEDVCNHKSELYFDCEAILDVVVQDSAAIEAVMRKIRQSRGIVNKVIQDDWKELEEADKLMRADRAMVVAIVDNTICDGRW